MVLNFCRVVSIIASTYNSVKGFKSSCAQIVILVSVVLSGDSDVVLVFFHCNSWLQFKFDKMKT